RMDGWALVKALRSRPELAHLPVIFLTALSSDEDRIRGFRLGADDYVPKPFRFEELDLRVAKTLRRTQAMIQDARDQMSQASLRGGRVRADRVRRRGPGPRQLDDHPPPHGGSSDPGRVTSGRLTNRPSTRRSHRRRRSSST